MPRKLPRRSSITRGASALSGTSARVCLGCGKRAVCYFSGGGTGFFLHFSFKQQRMSTPQQRRQQQLFWRTRTSQSAGYINALSTALP